MSESCTVQKRIHRKGWFIQWHNKPSTKVVEHSSIEPRTPQEKSKLTPNKIANHDTKTSTIQCFQKSLNQTPKNTKSARSDCLDRVETSPLKQKGSFTDSSSTSSDHTDQYDEKTIQFSQSALRSPTRIPTLAWILLYIGLALLALGITLAIIFFVANGSFIGAPLHILLTFVAAVLFLIWATQTALAPLKSEPAPPDPRYEKEEPKKEKPERAPLDKRDKIFLGVIAGLLLIIGISLLSF
ncbi:MAG: hypothetical protein NXI10_04485 [bacterium]|nr:hypothetical protein [bacterium]